MVYRSIAVSALLLAGLASFASGAQSDYNGFVLDHLTIPVDQIVRGGPPKDGIPALLAPRFEDARSASRWLEDDDVVIGISRGDESKAYPLRILLWHEAVNDTIAGVPVLVTYCPLCASALVFERPGRPKTLTFGVSGLLYMSNVLFYDHRTQSLWSQLGMVAVSGPMAGSRLALFPSVRATWKRWRELHPETVVLSRRTGTGYVRDYSLDPYRAYHRSETLLFPVARRDGRLPPKEKVLVVKVGDTYRAYPFRALEAARSPIKDAVGGVDVVITFDEGHLVSARRRDGRSVDSFVAYWFAWYAFRPDTQVWSP